MHFPFWLGKVFLAGKPMLTYKFCNPEKTFVHNIPTLTELMLQIYVNLVYGTQGITYPLKAKPGMQQGVVFLLVCAASGHPDFIPA